MLRKMALLFLIFAITACSSQEENQQIMNHTSKVQVMVQKSPEEIALENAVIVLQKEIEQALEPVEGTRGAAVLEVGSDRLIRAGSEMPMAQQSVSKLWVALTIAEAVSQGRMNYTDRITISNLDRAVFHQPLARRVANGPITITLGELMDHAITRSDNMANSVLMEKSGGVGAVSAWLSSHVKGVKFGPGDKIMQSGISGLEWHPSYSNRSTFERARNSVSPKERTYRFNLYARHPIDGADTASLVIALSQMRMGKYPGSRDVLRLMSKTRTGRSRLKAGLPEGWKLLHKTGTGQTWEGRRAGFNDIGLMESPNGRSYAVAVMIGNSSSPDSVMQKAIANVARAIGRYHENTNACCIRTS